MTSALSLLLIFTVEPDLTDLLRENKTVEAGDSFIHDAESFMYHVCSALSHPQDRLGFMQALL